ncbi:MAG: sigma-70 family RNA polymerase sigma factor [Acidobacteriota bacterium]|nr:sigma-70 family RNA polymerase sigma factor [Blastocatellia bacterium]MDW8412581.1 sigma-70 family RNA polymerase sigma factor [Acidobacteriota bacterium]
MCFYSQMSDEDLVRVCGASFSTLAWEEFTRRFDKLIRYYIKKAWLRYRQSEDMLVELQDDLTQEVYLKLFKGGMQSLRQFKAANRASFPAFIWRICFNAVAGYLRKTRAYKRRTPTDFYEASRADDWYDPEPQVMSRILIREISEQTGSDRQMKALRLYLQEPDTERVARLLGIKRHSAEQLIKRAGKRLQQDLCVSSASSRTAA